MRIASREALLPLLLGAVAVGISLGSLRGEFLFDDEVTVLGADYVGTLSWRALWPEKDLPVSGRPLSSLSFALNFALHGFDVWGYHATSVLLHGLCGLLLYGVVRRTALRPRQRAELGDDASIVAFAVALLWLVHPIQSEVIAYISARTESLMALCYLATLYCAIRADEAADRASRRFGSAAVVFCFAGMLTKEAMVSAPLIVFLYDWALREKPFREVVRRRRSLWVRLASSWFLLAAIVASGQRSASVNFEEVGAWQYLLNQADVVTHYFRAVFWPDPLLLHFGSARDLALVDVWPQAAALAALGLASALALARGSRLGFLGIAVFAILSPTSSFVPIWTEIGSLRRMYLPLAAFSAGAVWLAHLGLRRVAAGSPGALPPRARAVAALVLVAVALPLARLSIAHSAEFASAKTAWRAQVARAPKIAQGWFGLARELQKERDLAGAAQHYANALLLDPDSLEARVNLGNVRLDQGNVAEAIRQYEEALRRNGDVAFARGRLAAAQLQAGRPDRALAEYERAIALGEDEWTALTGLARLLVTHPDVARRDPERAVALAERACRATRLRELLPLEVYAEALAAAGRAQEAARIAEFTLQRARAAHVRVAYYERLFEQRRREAAAAGP